MREKRGGAPLRPRYQPSALAMVILVLVLLVGCGGPSIEDLQAVDYSPVPGGDLVVSTPEKHGLDPMLLAELYSNAAELETIYGLLVVKDGELIAEDYFHVGSVEAEGPSAIGS